MPVNPTQLREDVEALIARHDEHATARANKDAASANVLSVTTTEQALIDQATAHFDQATTEAKGVEAEKAAAERDAADLEQSALDKLLADAEEFEAPAP